MKYTDLVKEVAKNAEVSQSVAKQVMDSFCRTLPALVSEEDEVVVKGIGKFSKKFRSARTRVSPLTGGTIEMPAKMVPTFKFAKEIKDYVNS